MSPVAISLTLSTLLRSAANTADLATETNIKSGLSSSAQALAVATASISSPLLVVLPTGAEADQMLSDARFFYGSIQNLDKTKVSREVILFPSPEVDPYRGISPHLDRASARARTLVALAQGHSTACDRLSTGIGLAC